MAGFQGDRLKQVRIAKGLSQRELGDRLSISDSAISNWERGRNEPDSAMLDEMAGYFGVSVEYFFGGAEMPRTDPGTAFQYIRYFVFNRSEASRRAIFVLGSIVISVITSYLPLGDRTLPLIGFSLFWFGVAIAGFYLFFGGWKKNVRDRNVVLGRRVFFLTERTDVERRRQFWEHLFFNVFLTFSSIFAIAVSYTVFRSAWPDHSTTDILFGVLLLLVTAFNLSCLIQHIRRGVSRRQMNYVRTEVRFGTGWAFIRAFLYGIVFFIVQGILIDSGTEAFDSTLIWIPQLFPGALFATAVLAHFDELLFYSQYRPCADGPGDPVPVSID